MRTLLRCVPLSNLAQGDKTRLFSYLSASQSLFAKPSLPSSSDKLILKNSNQKSVQHYSSPVALLPCRGSKMKVSAQLVRLAASKKKGPVVLRITIPMGLQWSSTSPTNETIALKKGDSDNEHIFFTTPDVSSLENHSVGEYNNKFLTVDTYLGGSNLHIRLVVTRTVGAPSSLVCNEITNAARKVTNHRSLDAKKSSEEEEEETLADLLISKSRQQRKFESTIHDDEIVLLPPPSITSVKGKRSTERSTLVSKSIVSDEPYSSLRRQRNWRSVNRKLYSSPAMATYGYQCRYNITRNDLYIDIGGPQFHLFSNPKIVEPIKAQSVAMTKKGRYHLVASNGSRKIIEGAKASLYLSVTIGNQLLIDVNAFALALGLSKEHTLVRQFFGE